MNNRARNICKTMKWCDDLILQNQMIPPEEFCLIALHCHLHHLITFRFSFTFTISRWPELEKSDNCYVSTLSLSLWPELVLHHITGIEWDKALQSVIDCSGRQTPPVHSVNDWLKTLTQPQQRTNKKLICFLLLFLAVQNSSIGDLVACHWLTHSLTDSLRHLLFFDIKERL